jgi:tetratricopeptide (TPR) repeat protein
LSASPRPSSDAHPFSGQLVVFSGKLTSVGRKDACEAVLRLGGATAEDVTVKTTVLVVAAERAGSAGRGDSRDKSQKLRRAEELNAQQAAIEILSEDAFCRRAGIPAPADLRQQYHGVRDLLARYRALREDHLRYLIQCGVIRPVLRTNAETFFAFHDLPVIKQANDELARGHGFRTVVRGLLSEQEGQLSFDFRLDAEPARVISLEGRRSKPKSPAPPPDPALVSHRTQMAEEYFRAASAIDEQDEARGAEAAAAYRKALELDPYLVAALINLANIHYGRDELIEAQALYEQAIGLDRDYFEAHFNLGNIHHDLGRFPEARACYRDALRLNPTYADAHFYLAVTLEKMGLSSEARPHWSSYRQLAPKGEWVELAKEFSD